MKTGRPFKWDIKALPKRRRQAVMARWYGSASVADTLAYCRSIGAPANLNRQNMINALGPKAGTRKPEWAETDDQ